MIYTRLECAYSVMMTMMKSVRTVYVDLLCILIHTVAGFVLERTHALSTFQLARRRRRRRRRRHRTGMQSRVSVTGATPYNSFDIVCLCVCVCVCVRVRHVKTKHNIPTHTKKSSGNMHSGGSGTPVCSGSGGRGGRSLRVRACV